MTNQVTENNSITTLYINYVDEITNDDFFQVRQVLSKFTVNPTVLTTLKINQSRRDIPTPFSKTQRWGSPLSSCAYIYKHINNNINCCTANCG